VRAVGREPPSSPEIDWESLNNSALPNLQSRLKFTTHYALCVIDSEKWDVFDPMLKIYQCKILGASGRRNSIRNVEEQRQRQQYGNGTLERRRAVGP
jgi:hypothetical protein